MKLSEFKTILNQALIPMILIVVLPSTILGWVAAGTFNIFSLFVGLWIITTMDLAGNALNNVADWKIDELNEKRIELHQLINRKQLLLISILLFVASFPFFVVGNLYLKVAILIGYFVAVNYSVGLKTKNSVFANYVTIAIYYGPLAFIYGFLTSTVNISLFMNVIWMAIFIFFIDLGFAVTKDYEDIKGDKLEHKLTLPVVYGKKVSLMYQYITINLTFISVAILVFLEFISQWYLIVLAGYIIAIYVLRGVQFTESKEKFHLCHNLIRSNALLVRFILAFITMGIYLGIVA